MAFPVQRLRRLRQNESFRRMVRETLVSTRDLIYPLFVTEGRDQGSIVFPNAEFKFYLDAKPEERARRRVAQLRSRGEIVDYSEILNGIVSRDRRDATRSVGPLSVPSDAEVVDTTEMSQEQVVDHIVEQVRARQVV